MNEPKVLGTLWSRGLGTTIGSGWAHQIPSVMLNGAAPKGRNKDG